MVAGVFEALITQKNATNNLAATNHRQVVYKILIVVKAIRVLGNLDLMLKWQKLVFNIKFYFE